VNDLHNGFGVQKYEDDDLYDEGTLSLLMNIYFVVTHAGVVPVSGFDHRKAHVEEGEAIQERLEHWTLLDQVDGVDEGVVVD
jgi:cell division protein FtsL